VRTIHLSVCLLGALGATVFASTDAPAALVSTGTVTPITRTPVPIVPVIPIAPVCPSPSVSVCQAESGKTDTCAKANHTACVTILKNEYKAEYDATTSTGPMILPAGSSMTGAGFVTSGAVLPYDQRRIAYQWNADATLAAQTSAAHLPSAFGIGVSTFGVSASLAPLHPDWESNGGAITSTRSRGCAEYAYEKYYDVSRFEDAAASCLNDYACIYGVGMLTSTPGLAQPALHRRDGGVTPFQLTDMPAVSQPKNTFFAVNPGLILGVLDQISAGEPSDLVGAMATIGTALPTFRYETADRLGWHRAMHDGQASEGLTANDYRVMEERQAVYADLVTSYQLALAEFPGDVIASALHGTYTTTCGGTTTIGIPTVGGGTDDNPCTTVHTKTKFPSGSQGAYLQAVVFKMASLLLAEWSHKNPTTGALDHGCLDPSSTRCDWQPKAFARDYVGLWQKQREADYSHCAADTGDDLLVDPTYEYAPAAADLAGTPAMEAYMGRLEALFAAETADVPWLTTGSGASSTAVPDTVGNESSGGHSIGDPAWFAADYAYDSMWQLHFGKTPDGLVCNADGEVRGHLTADVTMFSNRNSIVDAYFDMTAGRSGDDSGHLGTYFKLFGADLYAPIDQTVGGSAGAWNLSKSTTVDGPHASVTFPVMGVPLTIAGGANLRFGYDASASATAPRTCIPAQNDGTYAVLKIAGNVTPWAAVDAYVSGSVDLDVVSVGLEATLNLLTAKLPINAQLALDFNTHDDAQVELTSSTSLELAELSGSLDAYAQVNLGFHTFSTDVTLFSWDGLHQSVPLYSFAKAYPLTAMNYALHKHSGG
jgi:hypothetical protein